MQHLRAAGSHKVHLIFLRCTLWTLVYFDSATALFGCTWCCQPPRWAILCHSLLHFLDWTVLIVAWVMVERCGGGWRVLNLIHSFTIGWLDSLDGGLMRITIFRWDLTEGRAGGESCPLLLYLI